MSVTAKMKNNTRYFNPANSKVTLTYPVQDTFGYNYRRKQSYEVRNYYHFNYIKSIGGVAYFYTLTYNDRNLPHWFEHVVCDNTDIRWFLNDSGFRQMLSSKYNIRLGYFITTEYGEGKGVRGKGNNPHYHVIFYLWNDEHKSVDDIITARQFKHLVQTYWQGSFRHPKLFRKGKAEPSNYHGLLGRLENVSACLYCCKYCIKDALIYHNLNELKWDIYMDILKRYLEKPYFATQPNFVDLFTYVWNNYLNNSIDIDKNSFDLFDDFRNCPLQYRFVYQFVDRVFNLFYKKTFRNRFSPKVFMSQGIGISALDSINVNEATVPICDAKKVVKNVPIPLYLYRKFYCYVVKDSEGNNRYILNDYGIEQRVKMLEKHIDDLSFLAKSVYQAVRPDLADYIEHVIRFRPELFKRYAQYKLIYEDRLCHDTYRLLEPIIDYESFMQPSCHFVSQDEFDIGYFLDDLRYRDHVYFSDYVRYFDVIDEVLHEYFLSKDRYDKEEYNLRREQKRQLNAILHNFN